MVGPASPFHGVKRQINQTEIRLVLVAVDREPHGLRARSAPSKLRMNVLRMQFAARVLSTYTRYDAERIERGAAAGGLRLFEVAVANGSVFRAAGFAALRCLRSSRDKCGRLRPTFTFL